MTRLLSQRTFALAAALLLLPALVVGNPHQGIYLGSFESAVDDSRFALLVDQRGVGTLVTYDALNATGTVEPDIPIWADGHFTFVTARGVRVEGRLRTNSLAGGYSAPGAVGTFIGRRLPADGPFAAASGYYAGPVSFGAPGGIPSSKGQLTAVVGADGSALFLLQRTRSSLGVPSPVGWEFDLDLGPGLDLEIEWAGGWGVGPNGCLPFGFGRGHSFEISLFGLLDVEFHQTGCGNAWSWFTPVLGGQSAGGEVRLQADGQLEAVLPDGTFLEGRLDPLRTTASGSLILPRTNGFLSGTWSMHLQYGVEGPAPSKGFVHHPDVNGDGYSDLVWTLPADGTSAVWLMRGGDVTTILPLVPPMGEDRDWSPVGMTDVDGDSEPDLIWRHRNLGDLTVAFADGQRTAAYPLPSAWEILATGDFDGDGRGDLLLEHTGTGEQALVADLTGHPQKVQESAPDPRDWRGPMVADFNGDGRSDVLYVNRHTGDLLLRLMDGFAPSTELQLAAPGPQRWILEGTFDFDQDGAADLVWSDLLAGSLTVTTGLSQNGGRDLPLSSAPPRGWQMAGSGDFNGDGRDDLLWRHAASGGTLIWQATADKLDEPFTALPLPAIAPHWSILP